MAHWSGTRSGWNQRGAPMSLREKLILEQEAFQRNQLRLLTAISNRLEPAEYDAWLDSTPDDNAGFNAAVAEKYRQVVGGNP